MITCFRSYFVEFYVPGVNPARHHAPLLILAVKAIYLDLVAPVIILAQLELSQQEEILNVARAHQANTLEAVDPLVAH